MGLRELIESVRELASAHRVAIITSFFITLVAIYSLAPIEWHVFFIEKTPKFFPFGVTLFDVLVIAVSLAVGLTFHGLIHLCGVLKKTTVNLKPKKIEQIWSQELNNVDKLVLFYLAYSQPIDDMRPDIVASKNKLREKKLVRYGYAGGIFAQDVVKSFIYEMVELEQIDLKQIFPDRY